MGVLFRNAINIVRVCESSRIAWPPLTGLLLNFKLIKMIHPKIKHQLDLMEKAAQCYKDIETIERLIGPMDPITTKVMVAELRNQYSITMSELLSTLLVISGQINIQP